MNSARRRIHDVLLLVRMCWLLAALAVLKRVLPLPSLIRFFDARPSQKARPVAAQRLVRLSRAVLRRTYRSDFCMQQSLLLFYFMRRQGHPARIHFGVARAGDGLAGHAWLELDGQPVVERQDPGLVYATAFSYPC